ncbi:MAG: hypothetical protein CVU35_02970 [Betaproteobacteria bacterium HGW-Betaproteobacteria-8]|nr:MAG: hypothetical protein CVU35_02970 [Betaproteobacteria bacterium HGW-Betaproteobacteria-8]
MIKRWLVNLGLLLLIAGIVTFLYLRPQPEQNGPATHEVSNLKLGDFSKVSIEFPAKAPVAFEKVDGYWHITQPYKARADQMSVQRILSIVAASSTEKFNTDDLAKFGLDQPKLKLKLDEEEFLFGTYNPVSGEQYLAFQGAVYLVDTIYSESAGTQVVEMIDKSPLKPTEKIAGFDFSRLEQWEEIRLNVDLADGKWKASAANAKPAQDEMNEWLEVTWKVSPAKSVEPYKSDRNATYPSFEVKLEGGGKVHFDKMQESPELLLARPDEGLIYHFAPDLGFAMLNPPLHIPKEE